MGWSRLRTSAFLAALAGMGCQGEPSARARIPARARPDKAFLYADPGLVPSRDGERARAELALSGELEAAVSVLPGVVEVRASISLGASAVERGLVLIRHHADTPPEHLRSRVEAISAAILPSGPVTLMFETTPVAEVPQAQGGPHTLGLALAFLGLGLSLGVSGERLRRLRRRS